MHRQRFASLFEGCIDGLASRVGIKKLPQSPEVVSRKRGKKNQENDQDGEAAE